MFVRRASNDNLMLLQISIVGIIRGGLGSPVVYIQYCADVKKLLVRFVLLERAIVVGTGDIYMRALWCWRDVSGTNASNAELGKGDVIFECVVVVPFRVRYQIEKSCIGCERSTCQHVVMRCQEDPGGISQARTLSEISWFVPSTKVSDSVCRRFHNGFRFYRSFVEAGRWRFLEI